MGIKLTKEQAESFTGYVESLSDEDKKKFVSGFEKLTDDGKVGVVSEISSKPIKSSVEAPTADDTYLAGVQKRRGQVQEEIAERGSILSDIKPMFTSPHVSQKVLAGLNTLGAPFQMLESGIANPSLEMQAGNFNPLRLLKESYLGFTGQKQGEYGDVYRVAGAPKVVGATGGLVLGFSGPLKIAKEVKRSLTGISHMSDKSLRKAGENLLQATTEAEKSAGASIQQAFKPYQNVQVDVSDFSRITAKIPPALKQVIKEELGDVNDMLPNIENLRKLKQIIGRYKPGAFGREARGLTENIQYDKLNNLYGSIKSTITNYVAKKAGSRQASQLLELEEKASAIYKASDDLKKIAVNPTLLKPTKAGKVAEKMGEARDISVRDSLNVLRGSGPEAKKLVSKVIRTLEDFNSLQNKLAIARHITSAMTYGGAFGAAGGMVLSKLVNKANPNED